MTEGEEIPAQSIMVWGRRVVLYQIGQGFPIVLLHGLIAKGAWSLKHLARKLSERFLVAGIHLPGYEGSEDYEYQNYKELAEMILEIVRNLGIVEKFHAFGASTGGAIAIILTSEFPERVAKLALFEPTFAQWNAWRPWRIAAFFANTPGFVWTLRQILPRTGLSDFKGAKSGSTIGTLIRTGKILSKSDFSPNCQRVADLNIPSLLAFGQRSSLLLSLSSMKQIARLMPQAQQIELPGADHTLRREFQEKLAGHLISFFSA
jgi:pimeloyl-ACP methyl ester carboxylesterase